MSWARMEIPEKRPGLTARVVEAVMIAEELTTTELDKLVEELQRLQMQRERNPSREDLP